MVTRAVVERRAGERLPLSIVVFVRGRDGSEEEFLDLATVVNLSATGALVRIKRYAGPNMEILVEFPAPPVFGSDGFVLQNTKAAYVVRSASSRRGELWGIRFEQPFGIAGMVPVAAPLFTD